MVFIFSALYTEAQPLIEQYRLKKKRFVHGVDSFQDEEEKIILSLTGSGVYHAIFAVSSVLAALPPCQDDQLLFFGSAASLRTADACIMRTADAGTSGVYRIAEISDLPSGRRYYPGISRNTGLPDAVAVTGMKILYKSSAADGDAVSDANFSAAGDDTTPCTNVSDMTAQRNVSDAKPELDVPDVVRDTNSDVVMSNMDVLYDMESSGVYEAASRHMGPDQITILRFVSDAGIEPQAPAETGAEIYAEENAEDNSAGRNAEESVHKNRDDNSLRTERASLRENLSRKAREAAPAAVRVIEDMLQEADAGQDKHGDNGMTGFSVPASGADQPSADSRMSAAGSFMSSSFAAEAGQLAERLCASVAMRAELMQYLKYAELCGIPWGKDADEILREGCENRREGKVKLRRLEEEILHASGTAGSCDGMEHSTADTCGGMEHSTAGSCEGTQSQKAEDVLTSVQRSHLLPPFSCIYIERAVADHPRTQKILAAFPNARRIYVENYREIFDRRRQNYPLQQAARALILARNTGELIHRGSPVCQSFDNRYFYYCSSVMNCLYDCEYCWLKGMYESGHMVIFVNLEDTFREVDRLLRQHPVYLCVSYDTDLLALDPLTGYARAWAEFAASRENLTIEIRSKGVGRLPDLALSQRTILAFTMSPDDICRRFEQSSPGPDTRIRNVQEAIKRGFPVRLCCDPVLVLPGWKKSMTGLMEELDRRIDWAAIRDVSIGTFRLSAEYIRRMRSRYPESALLQYPYVCENGYYHLPDDIEKDAMQYMTQLLTERIGKEQIFVWRETDKHE